MSNELVKRGAGYLAKNDDNAIKRGIAEVSLTAGGGGLALWVLAGVLPFITLPMILMALVVFGVVIYPKGRS
jgi:hypothetical protein